MFWDSDREEKVNDDVSALVTKFTDGIRDKHVYKRFLYICALGNIIIWLCVLLLPQHTNESIRLLFNLNDKLGMAVFGIPLGFGLYLAYLLIRIKFPDIEENKHLQSDFVESYNYQSDSTKRWFVWLASILVGITNVFLLVL